MTPLSSTSDAPFSLAHRLFRRPLQLDFQLRTLGVLAIILATFVTLALPSAADALCDPCEIYAMPNATSVSVPLEGLIAEDGDIVRVAGFLKGESDLLYGSGSLNERNGIYTYTPGPDFWTVGSDQASFSVRSANGVDGIRSLIFIAGDANPTNVVSFDFENSANLSEWTVFPTDTENVLGRPLTVSLVQRSAGSNFLLSHSSESTDRGVSGNTSNNNPDLARTQSISGHADGSETDLPNRLDPLEIRERVLTVSDPSLDDVVFVERLSLLDDDGIKSFYARGAISPYYFACNNRPDGTKPGEEDLNAPPFPCETRWMLLEDPQNQIIRFEIAQRLFGVDVPLAWSLQSSVETVTDDGNGGEQLTVEFQEEEWTSVRNLSLLPDVLVSRVGAINVESSDPTAFVTNRIKGAETVVKTFAGFPNVFTEDFDSLSSNALTSGLALLTHEGTEAQYLDGTINADPDQENDLAFFFDLTKLVPTTHPASYTPTGEAGDRTSITYQDLIQEDEVRLKMTLHTHPKSPDAMVNDHYPYWTAFDFLQIGKFDGTPGAGPIQVRMSVDDSGHRRFRLRAFGSNDGLINNHWLDAGPDKTISFTLHWKRNTSTNGTPNGFVHMIVNGQKVSVTGIENSGQMGEYIALGAWDLLLNHAPLADILPFGIDDIVIVGDPDLFSTINPNL